MVWNPDTFILAFLILIMWGGKKSSKKNKKIIDTFLCSLTHTLSKLAFPSEDFRIRLGVRHDVSSTVTWIDIVLCTRSTCTPPTPCHRNRRLTRYGVWLVTGITKPVRSNRVPLVARSLGWPPMAWWTRSPTTSASVRPSSPGRSGTGCCPKECAATTTYLV